MTARERTAGAETARRALRLLEVICSASQPVGLDELCDATGLTKSTAYRLVRVLQDEHYIGRDDDGLYRTGSRFIGLAAAAGTDVYAALSPLLQELVFASGESVTLHRRISLRTVLVLGLESSAHALRRAVSVGQSSSLYRGSAGLSISSFLTSPDLDRVLEAAAQAGEDLSLLKETMAEVRTVGYAMSFGANHPGLSGIAVPVPSPATQKISTSLAISGPSARWTRTKMSSFAPRMMATAKELGVQLDETLPIASD